MSRFSDELEGVRMARPHRAVHWTLLAAVALIAAPACRLEIIPAPLAPLAWSGDTLVVAAVQLVDYTDASTRRGVLHRAFQVRATSGHLFVSDVGSDQVALLDSAARIVRFIGRRGGGPGELRGASHLAIRNDRLFIAEAMNGRVSEFTLDGRFIQTYRAPYASGSIAAFAGGVAIISPARSTFGGVLVQGDNPRHALPRNRPITGRARDRWRAVPGHDLVAADSSGVWVFDQGPGDLCFFKSVQSHADCWTFPQSLRDRLQQYRDAGVAEVEARTGQHVDAAPLAKDMLVVGGRVAILLPLPELPIVLVDASDGTLTPAVIVGDTLPSWARRATGFAHDERSFVFVGDEGIGRVHLSPSGNTQHFTTRRPW